MRWRTADKIDYIEGALGVDVGTFYTEVLNEIDKIIEQYASPVESAELLDEEVGE